jgi:hypothetical protein
MEIYLPELHGGEELSEHPSLHVEQKRSQAQQFVLVQPLAQPQLREQLKVMVRYCGRVHLLPAS